MALRNFGRRQAGVAALLLGGSTLVLGQTNPGKAARVVEAETFVLRDHQGNRRAELGLDDGGASLALFDAKGQRRARLAVFGDGTSRLTFYDEKGRDREVLQVGPNGEPTSPNGDRNGKADMKSVWPNEEIAHATPRPADPEPPPADHGRAEALYRQYCVSCHAANGQGARARARMPKIPDFTDAKWQHSRGDAQLLAGIRDGRGADMPPFGTEISSEQARALVARVRAFGPGVPVAATAAAAVSDFERRLRLLQRQWDDLDRQIRVLAAEDGRP